MKYIANQVVILCGGRGIRLKPLTDEIPKALVQLNGRPILDYILDFYHAKGFKKFTLCVGYKGDKIREYYDVPRPGIEINFSNAGENAGMLKRLWGLRESVDERFFVCYGDTLINLDIERMIRLHSRQKAEVTIVMAKIRNPFGLITSNAKGWVTSFIEKPILNYYIGSFIIERSSLRYISTDMLREPDGGGLVNFFLSLIKRKRLAVFEHKGPQITFNTEDERRKAEERLGRFYTFSEGSTDI